jgi:hypothetical protein
VYAAVSGFVPAAAAAAAAAGGLLSTTSGSGSQQLMGEWLQIQLPEPVTVAAYTLGANSGGATPLRWALLGSSDGGATWTDLDTTYVSADCVTPLAHYNVTAVCACSTFRLVVTRVTPGSGISASVTLSGVALLAAPAAAVLSLGASGAVLLGRLGLGAALSPVQQLDVRGSAYVEGGVGIGVQAPAYALHLATDSAAKPSTGLWTVHSDARIKDNVVGADLTRCYDIVKRVPLRRYAWRPDVAAATAARDRSQLGWLAQDVAAVFPKAASAQPMYGLPDCLAVNNDQMYAALYGCVQRLQQQVEALTAHVRELQRL